MILVRNTPRLLKFSMGFCCLNLLSAVSQVAHLHSLESERNHSNLERTWELPQVRQCGAWMPRSCVGVHHEIPRRLVIRLLSKKTFHRFKNSGLTSTIITTSPKFGIYCRTSSTLMSLGRDFYSVRCQGMKLCITQGGSQPCIGTQVASLRCSGRVEHLQVRFLILKIWGRCHDFKGTTSSRFWGCSENSPLTGRFRPGRFTDEDQADFAHKQATVSHNAPKVGDSVGHQVNP